MHITKLSFLFIGLFLIANAVFSHEEGSSFEARENGYLVDIGYNEPEAGDSLELDFSLKDESGKDALYEYIWVQIAKDETTIFSGPLGSSEFGRENLSLRIFERGVYEIEAKYSQGTKVLALAKFPVEIKGEAPKDLGISLYAAAPAFLAGAVLAYIFLRKKA
jgi:hypothetical protein